MKKTMVATAAVLLTALAAVLHGQSQDQRDYKSFQLVYHSDTRGYHRPCG